METREIKFRAWDGKEMHYNVCINHQGKAIKSGYRSTDWVEDANAGIPMQYTGLKDKNEKEIYEGDVVKLNHVYPFNEGEPIIESVHKVLWKSNAWHFGDFDFSGNYYFGCVQYLPIEVLGNIYENPELISTKQL